MKPLNRPELFGSANGNRTCKTPVQSSSSESKCLSLRSSDSAKTWRHVGRNGDVAARWQRRGRLDGFGRSGRAA